MSTEEYEYPETTGYSGWAVLASAIVGLVVASLAVWLVVGGTYGAFYESMFRIAPTVEGGGVGSDWVAGNTVPWLDFLIALIHAADVLMGIFILFMVFLHWAAFRRLAARMRRPGAGRADAVATDGGQEADSRADEDARAPGDDAASDGGERR